MTAFVAVNSNSPTELAQHVLRHGIAAGEPQFFVTAASVTEPVSAEPGQQPFDRGYCRSDRHTQVFRYDSVDHRYVPIGRCGETLRHQFLKNSTKNTRALILGHAAHAGVGCRFCARPDGYRSK